MKVEKMLALVEGLSENEATLNRFFMLFPDYDVTLEGHAASPDTLVCWGTVRMTMKSEILGIKANGCRTELPVFIQFKFREEKILSEYFFFDLSEFCAQSGVSTDEMRRVFFPTNQQAESH